MTTNQLFKTIPGVKIVQEILDSFGLDNLEDTRLFTKEHMNDINTVEQIQDLYEKLNEYYLPCKSKKYLMNLDEKKCITLLRQFIKIHEYKCIGMEKSVKGRKTMTYRLMYSKEDYLKSPLPNSKKGYVLSFE